MAGHVAQPAQGINNRVPFVTKLQIKANQLNRAAAGRMAEVIPDVLFDVDMEAGGFFGSPRR